MSQPQERQTCILTYLNRNIHMESKRARHASSFTLIRKTQIEIKMARSHHLASSGCRGELTRGQRHIVVLT